MGPRPMGKARDLRRPAGRAASRSTVRRSWLWKFLGCCLLAVVGGPAVALPHAQVAAAGAGIPRSVQESAGLGQAITFDQPPDTTVGQQVTLTASSVTTTPPSVPTGLTVSFRSDTPAMCTVSGSTVTPTARGFCVITAFQGGDGTYAPAPDVAFAFRARAGSEPQTITFDQPAATAVGQPVAFTASSVTTTSPPTQTGLTVSFRSDTPAMCTVSGSTVTPTARGFCVITASQGGSATYAPAQPVRGSLRAYTGTRRQAITFDQPPDTVLGQQVTLSATTHTYEPLVVSFRSDSLQVCTVSGATVTTVAAGTCTVTAFQGGSATYAPAQTSRSFQVTDADRLPQQISFDPVRRATVGVPVVLTALSWTVGSDGQSSQTGLAVSYSSQTPGVCTVSGDTVVPWTAGRCMITASQDGDGTYAPASPVTQVFPVARASQTISFTPPTSATIGQPVTLTATASSWLPVSYTSSTPDMCTVSDNTVTGTAAGTCTITASQPGDGQYAPAGPVTGSFQVQKIPQTISFTPPNGAEAGQQVALSASATSNLGVSFTSDTPDVCTVSGSTATTIKAGTCAITASQPGDDRYAPADPVQKSFQVTPIPQTISFPPPPKTVAGKPVTLSATASSGLPVSYHADTPDVCTVSGHTVTTVKAGTCTITASQPGDDRYAPARDVTRSFPIMRAAQAITFTPPHRTTIGRPVTLSATASSGLPVSYHADTPDVCTVSGHTVTTVKAGTCTITASQPGDDRYAPARDVPRSFTVRAPRQHVSKHHDKKASQAIVFGRPPGADVGQVDPLSASTTSGLAVSFRSDTPSVCTVSGTTVTTITAGTCVITASQPGSTRYLAARDVQRSFAVQASQAHGNKNHGQSSQAHPGHQAQTITFPQQPEAKVGKPVTLSASATSGLAVAFRSDTPRICTVSGSSLTPTAAGTCTVTASQGGNDRYAAARDVEQTFDVAPATSILPGALTIALAAAVFAATGAAALVRRLRRRSRRPLGHQPSVRAAPVPGPPPLVSVQNTGAGVTHTVRIESSPGANITTIKEARP